MYIKNKDINNLSVSFISVFLFINGFDVFSHKIQSIYIVKNENLLYAVNMAM